MRKIDHISETINGTEYTVKVYRDTQWNEYICRLFIDGIEHKDSSYHTDDKEDALASAYNLPFMTA